MARRDSRSSSIMSIMKIRRRADGERTEDRQQETLGDVAAQRPGSEHGALGPDPGRRMGSPLRPQCGQAHCRSAPASPCVARAIREGRRGIHVPLDRDGGQHGCDRRHRIEQRRRRWTQRHHIGAGDAEDAAQHGDGEGGNDGLHAARAGGLRLPHERDHQEHEREGIEGTGKALMQLGGVASRIGLVDWVVGRRRDQLRRIALARPHDVRFDRCAARAGWRPPHNDRRR